jgi:hypothetical protein
MKTEKFIKKDIDKVDEKKEKEISSEQLGGTFNEKSTGNPKIDKKNKNATGRPTEDEEGATFGIGSL